MYSVSKVTQTCYWVYTVSKVTQTCYWVQEEDTHTVWYKKHWHNFARLIFNYNLRKTRFGVVCVTWKSQNFQFSSVLNPYIKNKQYWSTRVTVLTPRNREVLVGVWIHQPSTNPTCYSLSNYITFINTLNSKINHTCQWIWRIRMRMCMGMRLSYEQQYLTPHIRSTFGLYYAEMDFNCYGRLRFYVHIVRASFWC